MKPNVNAAFFTVPCLSALAFACAVVEDDSRTDAPTADVLDIFDLSEGTDGLSDITEADASGEPDLFSEPSDVPDPWDAPWDGNDPFDIYDLFDTTDDFTPDEEIPDTIDVPVDSTDVIDIPTDEAADELPSEEIWMEINYRYRSTFESPTTADWSYSPTPSWTASEWAPESSSWPYIHVPDGGSLVSDPIGGTVLELGCHDRFRLFFGLEELSHVGYATVTLEGRSRATSSGVDIEIWNPGAGSSIISSASMSQDWTVDIVTVDFTAEAGNGFQAVEIAPVARSCNLALRRVRITLH